MPIGCMCHALLFLEQTAFMPCPQHYQEYLSFLLNVLKLKKINKKAEPVNIQRPRHSPRHFWDI